MFVYRAEAGQRLSDVREKLQTIFPHAILLDPTLTIEEHHRKNHCQCKLINSNSMKSILSFVDVQVQVVQPISDEKVRFGNRNIPEAIVR